MSFRKQSNVSRFISALFTTLSVVVLILSVVAGLYTGIKLCLIDGIVQLIEAAKSNPVSSTGVAFGIIKFIIAGPAGWFVTFIGGTLARVIAAFA